MFSLRFLSKSILKRQIQGGNHSSVEDAIATMQLFQLVQSDYENRHDRILVPTRWQNTNYQNLVIRYANSLDGL